MKQKTIINFVSYYLNLLFLFPFLDYFIFLLYIFVIIIESEYPKIEIKRE